MLSTLRGHRIVPPTHTHTSMRARTHTHRVIHTLQEYPRLPQWVWQHLDLSLHLHYMHAWTHMSSYYWHTQRPQSTRDCLAVTQIPSAHLVHSITDAYLHTHTFTRSFNVRCSRHLWINENVFFFYSSLLSRVIKTVFAWMCVCVSFLNSTHLQQQTEIWPHAWVNPARTLVSRRTAVRTTNYYFRNLKVSSVSRFDCL